MSQTKCKTNETGAVPTDPRWLRKNSGLFRYEELSAKARAVAREWWTNRGDGYVDDGLIKETLQEKLRELWGDQCFSTGWSLNYCQGDGVAFWGRVDLEELAQVDETVAVAMSQRGLWNAANKAAVEIYCKVSHVGGCYHSRSMDVGVTQSLGGFCYGVSGEQTTSLYEITTSIQEHLDEKVRQTSEELSKVGYSELEFYRSDEYVSDTLTANDHLFTADGGPVS